MLQKLAVIIILFWASACVKSVPTTSQSVEDRIDSYEEDLSLVRPSFEIDVVKEEEEPQELEASKAFQAIEPKNDNQKIEEVIDAQAAKNALIEETQGFRISIFSGNSRGEYESAKSYILQYFPELEIYDSYSQPTYKVKVGDFLTRMEAEKYYAQLSRRFATPKIMSDVVSYSKGLKIKKQ